MAEGNTGCSTGSRLRVGYICSSGVHRRSRRPVGGKVDAGVLTRASSRGRPHAGVPTRASPRGRPHAGVPTRASPRGRPHAGVPTRASPRGRPHAGVPTRASPRGRPHAGVLTRASSRGRRHAGVVTRASSRGRPHAGVLTRASSRGRPHAGVLTRASSRGRPHAGVLTRASGGWSLLLIRAADPSPRISRRFLAGDALRPPMAKSSQTDCPPTPPTIPATCKGIFWPTAGTCSLHSPICHRKKHTTVVQSLQAGPGLDRGAGVGVPDSSRRRSVVSISVVAGRGGDAGASAGAEESRRSSIVSISVGTGRGGGAGTFGSNCFSNVSRSANLTEGVICLPHIPTGSSPVHKSPVVCMALPHSTSVHNVHYRDATVDHSPGDR